MNNFGDFEQVDGGSEPFELIAANSDGVVLERSSIDSGISYKERVTIDYERVSNNYRGFIADLDQLASTLPLNRPISINRDAKGLFAYNNTTSQDQVIEVTVNGVEQGASGETTIAAFSKSAQPLYLGQLNYEALIELEAINGNSGILEAVVPAGLTVYITYDFTDYEPLATLSDEQKLRFYENDSFNLTFTALNLR